MGVFPESILVVQARVEGTEEMKERNSNGSVWKQTLIESKADKTSRRRIRCSLKKRRSSANGIGRRVSRLRSLVPNTNNEAVGGLEQLFTQTADYILSLQTRVRLMQTMVDVLSAGSSDE